MHELSLMQELMRLVEQSAREGHASAVSAIQLEVGQMSGVDPQALRFAFDAVVAGTLAEGAQLLIDSVPTIVRCHTCNTEFAPADFVYECPHCHTIGDDVCQGNELTLVSVEVIADD